MSRASSVPEMTRIRIPVSRSTSAMKSPPLSASRVALVAAAMISSTLCVSASRRNLVRVWSAAATAVGVRLRPSRPPAPSLTISFSRSITSKERSGLTFTTIMWIEFVPMSMAAIRMRGRTQPGRGLVLLHARYILAERTVALEPQGRAGRHPTMNRRKPRVTTSLLARRARALQRYLPAAIRGDHHGVHQARVATRRLREAVPVLTRGVKGARAGKARVKIRRLTRALGTVRELDVTLHLIDELAKRPDVSRNALEDVR